MLHAHAFLLMMQRVQHNLLHHSLCDLQVFLYNDWIPDKYIRLCLNNKFHFDNIKISDTCIIVAHLNIHWDLIITSLSIHNTPVVSPNTECQGCFNIGLPVRKGLPFLVNSNYGLSWLFDTNIYHFQGGSSLSILWNDIVSHHWINNTTFFST